MITEGGTPSDDEPGGIIPGATGDPCSCPVVPTFGFGSSLAIGLGVAMIWSIIK